MTVQAWHTCIWGVSPLLCRSFQALSGCMGSVSAQLFLGLSRDVRLCSGWDTQGHWDLSRSHSCIVLAACLGALSCWKVNLCPSLSSWALWSAFFLYFALFIFSSILTSLLVPSAEKHPHSMMLPPPCFTVEMVPGILQMCFLAFRPKSSILVSLENLVSHGLSLGAFWQTPSELSCDLLRSGFRLATLP